MSPRTEQQAAGITREGAYVSDSLCEGLEGQRNIPSRIEEKLNHACDSSWWSTEPNVGRVVNGTSLRMDRIKALGNGVVPLQARTAFELLMGKFIVPRGRTELEL